MRAAASLLNLFAAFLLAGGLSGQPASAQGDVLQKKFSNLYQAAIKEGEVIGIAQSGLPLNQPVGIDAFVLGKSGIFDIDYDFYICSSKPMASCDFFYMQFGSGFYRGDITS